MAILQKSFGPAQLRFTLFVKENEWGKVSCKEFCGVLDVNWRE
jgi:hypothetical protein